MELLTNERGTPPPPDLRQPRQPVSIELRHIRICIEVARHGAIRRAASSLNIDEAAVSRTIKNMEDTLGVSLFERYSGGIRITDAGRNFLADVQPAVETIRRATANAGAAGRGESGRLQLGVVWSAAAGPSHTLISDYRLALPAVALALTEDGSTELANALLDRSLDVALLVGDLFPRSLSHHPLWDERLHFAVSSAAPSPESPGWDLLASRPLLIATSEDSNMLQRLAYRDGGPRFQIELQDCSREGVLGLVAAGVGAAIVCESATLIPIPGVRFEPIDAPHGVCAVCAAWLPENDNPALRRFISLIKTRYPIQPRSAATGARPTSRPIDASGKQRPGRSP